MIEEEKCSNCGASLSLFPRYGRAFCEYCGANFKLNNKPIESSGVEIMHNDDNPRNITFVREETEAFHYDYSEHPHPNFLGGLLSSDLIVIAGLSYVLKKTYCVSVDLGSYPTDYERPLSKIIKRGYKDSIDAKKSFDRRRSEVIAGCNELSKYGIDTEESRETTSLRLAYKKNIKLEMQYRDIQYTSCKRAGTTVIVPSFFKQVYPQVEAAYRQVRERKEISLIAEECIKYLYENESSGKNLPLNFNSHGLAVGLGGFALTVNYHSLGMQNAPNDEIRFGIGIAVLEKAIIGTANSAGDYNWDIHQGDDRYGRYIMGGLTGGLKYQYSTVKHYDSW